MDKRTFERKLKEENLNLNVEMPKKLKNEHIETKKVENLNSENSNDKFKWLFNPKFATIISCCLVFICSIFCVLFIDNKSDESLNLTSYIMEINPSICVTTDATDKIINVCALNEDANSILNNNSLTDIVGYDFEKGINAIIDVVFEEGYFSNYEDSIKLYAINDNSETMAKKLDNFENVMKKKMDDLGAGEIPFEKHGMEMHDFKDKLGIEDDFKKLDDMHNFLKNKDKNHSPKHNDGDVPNTTPDAPHEDNNGQDVPPPQNDDDIHEHNKEEDDDFRREESEQENVEPNTSHQSM